jgi:hypothetical protein
MEESPKDNVMEFAEICMQTLILMKLSFMSVIIIKFP